MCLIIQKPKKRIPEKIKEQLWGSKKKEQKSETADTGLPEKIEKTEEQKIEEEILTPVEEVKTKAQETGDSEKSESQEAESNAKTPNKLSQNITDKF